MSRNCLVSIATYSYLSKAIVMADTYIEFNSGCDVIILVPDMSQANIDSRDWPVGSSSRILGLDALKNPLIREMHKYFNAFELCCALKSFLLHHVLFIEGYDKAIQLDPDIMCYASFDVIWSEMDNTDIILTPHTSSPMPEDGEVPDDLEFVSAGFINGGFMAVRSNSRTEVCVNWLMKKVSEHGFFAPQFHSYADQTWLSCLPWYFPDSVSVFRNVGLNVAYWNIHERNLVRKAEGYFSNDQPLIFFHFSGFDSKWPRQLSRHTKRTFNTETNTTLSSLLIEYEKRLKKVDEQIPSIVSDFACSQFPFYKRLEIFKDFNSSAAEVYSNDNILTKKIFNRIRLIIFRFRALFKK